MEEIAGYSTEEYELMVMDGYDDCIAGVVARFGQDPIVCYDLDKVIAKLMAGSDMNHDEAVEFFEFNMIGAWVGDKTPCFITYDNKEDETP